MISVASARALASSGVVWEPARGDRFVIADRGMDDDVFVLSDMTIETHDHRTGRVIGFNGTTEWALDSIDADDALWLPGEGVLRELLGPAFVRLESAGLAGWAVTVATADGQDVVVDADAEEAYALALLSVRATSSASLLPLAAHAVIARTEELDAAGDGRAWEPAQHEVVDALVAALRLRRAVLTGAGPEAALEQAALVEDADPVAEDRAGTLHRAVAATLRGRPRDEEAGAADREQAVGEQSGGRGRWHGDADDLLVRLVVAVHDLGSSDVALVCVRRAVEVVRARGVETDAPAVSSARTVQSVEAALDELVTLVRG